MSKDRELQAGGREPHFDEALSAEERELLSSFDPDNLETIAAHLAQMSIEWRREYAKHHRELSKSSGNALIAYAHRLGFTDEDTEKSRWRDHMTFTRDAGDRQIGNEWRFGGRLHRAFVDTERRSYFLSLLRRMIVGGMSPSQGKEATDIARGEHRNRIAHILERLQHD